MDKNKIIKALATRLFVALTALNVVGWIILFGKNIPSSFTPLVYAIIAMAIIMAIYVLWRKPYLLYNKKIVVGMVVFIIVGAIGWLTSISEIMECRPYKCGGDFICAKPTDLGMKITTGECTSDFSEKIGFSCVKEDQCIKKFIKERSQEQRAVEIATVHLSFPVTIIEVKKLECQGCFSVKLQRDDNQYQFTVILDNWKIKN